MVACRIDYVKFLFLTSPDEMQRKWTHLREAMTYGDVELAKSMKLTALGAEGVIGGNRRYVVEAWGTTASRAEYLADHWINNLTRLDVKSNYLHWDDADIENLASRLIRFDTRRNVQTFRSRARTKKGGRSAGGQGLALGSHKSDLRVTVYKRPGELYQMEAQVSGRLLRKLIDEAKEEVCVGSDGSSWDVWFSLQENCMNTGANRILESAGFAPGLLPATVHPPNLDDPTS